MHYYFRLESITRQLPGKGSGFASLLGYLSARVLYNTLQTIDKVSPAPEVQGARSQARLCNDDPYNLMKGHIPWHLVFTASAARARGA